MQLFAITVITEHFQEMNNTNNLDDDSYGDEGIDNFLVSVFPFNPDFPHLTAFPSLYCVYKLNFPNGNIILLTYFASSALFFPLNLIRLNDRLCFTHRVKTTRFVAEKNLGKIEIFLTVCKGSERSCKKYFDIHAHIFLPQRIKISCFVFFFSVQWIFLWFHHFDKTQSLKEKVWHIRK